MNLRVCRLDGIIVVMTEDNIKMEIEVIAFVTFV